MALAVAGALAAPAAALAQVQIGGSLTVFYYSHDPDNKSVGKTGDILESSEPEMYIRSEEKLGGGMSAWFLHELARRIHIRHGRCCRPLRP
jgi:hypothetical protein